MLNEWPEGSCYVDIKFCISNSLNNVIHTWSFTQYFLCLIDYHYLTLLGDSTVTSSMTSLHCTYVITMIMFDRIWLPCAGADEHVLFHVSLS